MTLAQIATATGGSVADAAPDQVVSGPAFLDSRVPVDGGLFVAVPGERVDGHEYARQAVGGGAAAVLAERPVGVPAVVVTDSVVALGRLASAVRERLSRLQVVGITGSQGKTSTKDLLAALLESVGPTIAPVESFNNEIGVPITALRADEDTRYLVSEMGARGPGHIAYLCSLVRPTVGVVTNVGVAHIGEFGSREGIAAAKGELIESLPADGVAVLNADDPLVWAMRSRTTATVVGFGTGRDADVRIGEVQIDSRGRPAFELGIGADRTRVGLRLVGAHQVFNAAAAASAAHGLDVPFAAIVAALEDAQARSRWRMEVTTAARGYTLINDAYNANPDSVAAALRALAGWDRGHAETREAAGRTVAVLGEMRELGDRSDAGHRDVGVLAADLGIDVIVAVGEGAQPIVTGARANPDWSGDVTWVPDGDSAVATLRGVLRPADVVLVKASRAAALERVAAALNDDGPNDDVSDDDASGVGRSSLEEAR